MTSTDTYYYTGIGSRKTPQDILQLMEQLAYHFADEGGILRSGHAPGADQAFERGAGLAEGEGEIYLPWRLFEGDTPIPKCLERFDNPNDEAFEIAAKYHPQWSRLKQPARMFHARNCHQVLGWDLKTPAEFLICWTPRASGIGGSGQAIRIANDHDIPVYDLANPKYADWAWKYLM